MTRGRDLGIPLEGTTGPLNAITDVTGVEVGFTTLISGSGKLVTGKGPVRTGVTVILPRGKKYDPVFAAFYDLNGNGEMTGVHWVEESGFLDGPVAITNTHSVGAVHQASIAWAHSRGFINPNLPGTYWSLPVVGETFDGSLNDVNGFHVKEEHVFAAYDGARTGQVAEGNVGGGTGMRCHGFKGGTGTASRKLPVDQGDYTVGVLVQANHGARKNLTISGTPVGHEISDLMPVFHTFEEGAGSGSIIVVVATDAPLLPHQLKRLARRVPLGIARLGGMGENGSGDIFIAFSTANSGAATRDCLQKVDMLPNDQINPLFEATVQATEEAIINALIAAETMEGVNGNISYAIPHDRLINVLKKYNRI